MFLINKMLITIYLILVTYKTRFNYGTNRIRCT